MALKSAEKFWISSTFGNFSRTWGTQLQPPTSGGGGVDPVDVPAVLEIFSTSADNRWFVGLVVKQVGGDGWSLEIREGPGIWVSCSWCVFLKKKRHHQKKKHVGTPKILGQDFFFGLSFLVVRVGVFHPQPPSGRPEPSDNTLFGWTRRTYLGEKPKKWWQLKYFFLFSPRKLGKISHLTDIFADGLVQPPTRNLFHVFSSWNFGFDQQRKPINSSGFPHFFGDLVKSRGFFLEWYLYEAVLHQFCINFTTSAYFSGTVLDMMAETLLYELITSLSHYFGCIC